MFYVHQLTISHAYHTTKIANLVNLDAPTVGYTDKSTHNDAGITDNDAREDEPKQVDRTLSHSTPGIIMALLPILPCYDERKKCISRNISLRLTVTIGTNRARLLAKTLLTTSLR